MDENWIENWGVITPMTWETSKEMVCFLPSIFLHVKLSGLEWNSKHEVQKKKLKHLLFLLVKLIQNDP